MKRENPDLFRASVQLEAKMNERRASLGKDKVFLSYKAIPLTQVVGDHDQLEMFEASCDIGGYCHA
jgi:hypothetical protein